MYSLKSFLIAQSRSQNVANLDPGELFISAFG